MQMKMRILLSVIHNTVCSLSAAVIVLFYSSAEAGVYSPSIASLTATINTLAKARNNIVRSHRNALDTNKGYDSEEDDLRIFISYLDGRIYYYCEQLYNLGGTSVLRDTPCPTNQDGTLETTPFTTLPAMPSQTTGDRISDLETTFGQSLGTFDEMLLEEQQKIASTAPKQYEDSNGSGQDRFESGNDGDSRGSNESSAKGNTYPGNSGSPARGDRSPGQSVESAATGSNSGTGVGSTKQSQTPPTSGNKDLSQTDDDIIAKQLKEAAEQETDPEVKEKLWEEYRKYKEGIR